MLLKNKDQPTFTLANFEGPLALLFQLVQKQELEISEISLFALIEQYLRQWEEKALSDVDTGAEFISMTASLLVLKSKRLLPDPEPLASGEQLEEFDTPRAILSLLMEYLRFKQLAGDLAEREQQHRGSFPRAADNDYEPSRKLLGIDQISLDSLQQMFNEVLKRTDGVRRVIHEETWRVSDKIKHIRELLRVESRIFFEQLLHATSSRVELIVTFLATLELMKLGEVGVKKEKSSDRDQIWLVPGVVYG